MRKEAGFVVFFFVQNITCETKKENSNTSSLGSQQHSSSKTRFVGIAIHHIILLLPILLSSHVITQRSNCKYIITVNIAGLCLSISQLVSTGWRGARARKRALLVL